jgi:hypothetical protein
MPSSGNSERCLTWRPRGRIWVPQTSSVQCYASVLCSTRPCHGGSAPLRFGSSRLHIADPSWAGTVCDCRSRSASAAGTDSDSSDTPPADEGSEPRYIVGVEGASSPRMPVPQRDMDMDSGVSSAFWDWKRDLLDIGCVGLTAARTSPLTVPLLCQ